VCTEAVKSNQTESRRAEGGKIVASRDEKNLNFYAINGTRKGRKIITRVFGLSYWGPIGKHQETDQNGKKDKSCQKMGQREKLLKTENRVQARKEGFPGKKGLPALNCQR